MHPSNPLAYFKVPCPGWWKWWWFGVSTAAYRTSISFTGESERVVSACSFLGSKGAFQISELESTYMLQVHLSSFLETGWCSNSGFQVGDESFTLRAIPAFFFSINLNFRFCGRLGRVGYSVELLVIFSPGFYMYRSMQQCIFCPSVTPSWFWKILLIPGFP